MVLGITCQVANDKAEPQVFKVEFAQIWHKASLNSWAINQQILASSFIFELNMTIG
jgi:hypothetical protein